MFESFISTENRFFMGLLVNHKSNTAKSPIIPEAISFFLLKYLMAPKSKMNTVIAMIIFEASIKRKSPNTKMASIFFLFLCVLNTKNTNAKETQTET